jgi:hypothetical protein
MDPLYAFQNSSMTEAQAEFIFSLYHKYTPPHFKGTKACGGESLIYIIGIPSESAEACLREIVECLKERFICPQQKLGPED